MARGSSPAQRQDVHHSCGLASRDELAQTLSQELHAHRILHTHAHNRQVLTQVQCRRALES